MLKIASDVTPASLLGPIGRLWQIAGPKLMAIDQAYRPESGSPVFTREGRYISQGWTEWTQGFQFGAALLQFDATGNLDFLHLGRQRTWNQMAPHVSHFGVHDHGFNNVSTYGNLRRLLREGRLAPNEAESQLYDLALKVSGAVQAQRWTVTADGGGYIYSFNGPHSLFCDTIRSLRSLALAHHLGHGLMGENDRRISLLKRLCDHARTTAKHNVYYGLGRDQYDIRGRVAHESIFNTNDGNYRNPSTQQGYSPFTTWTRGLAWIMTGFAELLEYLAACSDTDLAPCGGREEIETVMLNACRATCDFYIEQSPSDGIPYWDTGAPGLIHLPNYRQEPADPFNQHEPVDSSAAAIGAQGLIRLGNYLESCQQHDGALQYRQAGLTVLRRLLSDTYLSLDQNHQGLLLHTIYHRPRGWDATPTGSLTPHSESCMWGDYHLLEVSLLVQRMARGEAYLRFW